MKILWIFFMLLLTLFSCGKDISKEETDNIVFDNEIENINKDIIVKSISIEETEIIWEQKEEQTLFNPYIDWNITINFWTGGYELLDDWNIYFWDFWWEMWTNNQIRCIKLDINENNIELSDLLNLTFERVNDINSNMWYLVWEDNIKNLILWKNIQWYYSYYWADMLDWEKLELYINNKNYTFKRICNENINISDILNDWTLLINNYFNNYNIGYEDYIWLKNSIYYYFSIINSWSKNNSSQLLEIAYNLKYQPSQSLGEFIEIYKDIENLDLESIENLWENKYKALVEIDWDKYESIFEIVEEYKIKTVSVKVIK